LDPEFAVHYYRGLRLERSGRAEEAIEAYRQAIRANRSSIDAQIRLGLLLRGLGRDDEANRAFLAALDLQSRTRPWPPTRRLRRPRRYRAIGLDTSP
jgi:tetratricopeptide (TPR) repeat protein